MAYNYEYPYTDVHRHNDDWMINRVKELSLEWIETRKEWNNTQEEFASLKAFIQNYFSQLDVQDEVNVKLDIMARDGSLSALISPLFSEYKKEIDRTMSEQNGNISILKARMDAFTALSEGSTTGDAELIDGRVDYKGNTHTNIGEHIREVSSQLFSEIVNVNAELASINGYIVTEWESGSINGSTGANAVQPARIRTKGYLPNNIKVTPSQGIKCMGFYYNSDDECVGSGIFFDEEHTYSNGDASYVRLVVGFTDDRQITKDDIQSVSNLFKIHAIDCQLNEVNDLKEDFNKFGLKYGGNMKTLGLTSFLDIGTLSRTPRYYNFPYDYISSITDKPSDLNAGGIVELFPYSAGGVNFIWITDSYGNKWFTWDGTFKKIISSKMLSDIEQLKSSGGYVGDGTVWYALGDSITQGFCSYLDESGKSAIKIISDCWAKKVADLCGYTFTNHGVGGSGFVHNGTVLDKLNARNHVDTIDFSNCDLVTIAYGVNDWKYNMPLGTMSDDITVGGTFYSNMRYVIEKILGDNPLCKIVVITPLNCSVYGDEVTNWGIGHSFSNNGTLEEIFEAEKEVCEYYGIEMIDMTHNSVINRKNITSLLPDGVHPSEECHGVIAKELAKKINFK